MGRSYQLVTTSLMAIFFLTGASSLAKAETNIHVSNNGENAQSDVSVKTTNGKSTVCINGECSTYEGDVDVKTENGKTKIKITNTADTSASGSPKPTETKNRPEDVVKTIQKEGFDLMNYLQKEFGWIRNLFGL